MYRSHNCGELNASHVNKEVTLAGWVQKSRDKGFMNWVDLRDRYGITQLIFDESRTEKTVFESAKNLGREFVIQVKLWNKPGAIFLPVTQLCEEGRLDWNQVPDAKGKKLLFPAPMLEVVPGLHAHH